MFMGKTKRPDFPEYVPLQKCRTIPPPKNDFYPITHSSTQEHGTWKWNCYCQQEMAVELKSRLLLTVERVMVCVRRKLAIVFICHLLVKLFHVIWRLHEELFSKWQGYSKQCWWQILSDRRPLDGRKLLASRRCGKKASLCPWLI